MNWLAQASRNYIARPYLFKRERKKKKGRRLLHSFKNFGQFSCLFIILFNAILSEYDFVRATKKCLHHLVHSSLAHDLHSRHSETEFAFTTYLDPRSYWKQDGSKVSMCLALGVSTMLTREHLPRNCDTQLKDQ